MKGILINVLLFIVFFGIIAVFQAYGEAMIDFIGRDRLRASTRVSLILIFVFFGIGFFGIAKIFFFPQAAVKVESKNYTLDNPKVTSSTKKSSNALETRKGVFVGQETTASTSIRMTYAELWAGLRKGDPFTIYFACLAFGMLFGTLSLFYTIFVRIYVK